MADPIIGRHLGDYEVLELLGKGGMARVYKGYDAKLQRYAAVKVMSVETQAVDLKEVTERFFREARAIARLRHPNIVGVYQLDRVDDEQYFMAMAFIEGQDLRQILRDHTLRGTRMPAQDILNIVGGIAAALDYAHGQGVIHRDVKPSNIMLDKDGTPILTDFGLVLSASEGTLGQTFGSPHYISPEQAVSSNRAVTRSDLYSLGVCTFEMLVGKVPFDDPSGMSVAIKHMQETPPPPRMFVPTLAPAVDDVIYKILDKDPERRYATGFDYYEALSHALAEDTGVLPTAQRRTTGLVPRFPTDSQIRREMTPIVPPQPKSFEWEDMDDDEDFPQETRPTYLGVPEATTPPPVPVVRATNKRTAIVFPLLLIGIAVLLAAVALLLLSFPATGSSAQTVTAAALAALATQTAPTPTESPSQTPTKPALSPVMQTNTVGVASVVGPLLVTGTPQTPTARSESSPTRPTLIVTPATHTPIPTTAIPTKPPTALPPTPTATYTATATITHSPTPDGQVMLHYEEDQLILINISAENVDISDIEFIQLGAEERRFTASQWGAVSQAQFPPSNLPPTWCFQVIRTEAGQARPIEPCRRLSSFRVVAPSRQFWVAAGADVFLVKRGDVTLATCQIRAGSCVIKLS